ncbi:transposable element Tcb1 transposase [Trichonephila clavipes]|nr:transposable element Tcb1 transposase [Trichonephila clavipes]
MDWPARFPDLNPIEHVWDFLGRRLSARTLPPVTIRELRLALQDEWAAMPQQLIDTLILNMGRRCETCLAVVLHCAGHYPGEATNVWNTWMCHTEPTSRYWSAPNGIWMRYGGEIAKINRLPLVLLMDFQQRVRNALAHPIRLT